MDELNTATNTVVNYNWTYWVAGAFALWQAFKGVITGFDWLLDKFGIETKRMRENRKMKKKIEETENAIVEIKNTAKKNVEMFLTHEQNIVNTVVSEFEKINIKLDEQKAEMVQMNEASIKTDCVMLRDRLASGMRYFSQNKDEDGNVHISFSDYENMDALFQEYFSKGGNGAFRKAYETEFQLFIIDR